MNNSSEMKEVTSKKTKKKITPVLLYTECVYMQE